MLIVYLIIVLLTAPVLLITPFYSYSSQIDMAFPHSRVLIVSRCIMTLKRCIIAHTLYVKQGGQ